MEENKTETINSQYESLMEKPLEIFRVFSDYFGEDKVDLKEYRTKAEFTNYVLGGMTPGAALCTSVRNDVPCFTLLVWFPEVKITNENNKSTYVKDLYVKIFIDVSGQLLGEFYINRATYTHAQLCCRYIHSHVPRLDTLNPASFRTPCTGEGPINNTISSLNMVYDIDLWQLFCSELEDFVQTESIAGVPYIRLESLGGEVTGGNSNSFFYVMFNQESWYRFSDNTPVIDVRNKFILDFVRYLLKSKVLPMEYSNGTYSLGMSPVQATILVSNKFIEWFNKENNIYRKSITEEYLISYGVLTRAIVAEDSIYAPSADLNADDISRIEGYHICNFKGKPITVTVLPEETSQRNLSLVLNQKVMNNIVTAICKVVNFRYGRKSTEQESKFDRPTLYI